MPKSPTGRFSSIFDNGHCCYFVLVTLTAHTFYVQMLVQYPVALNDAGHFHPLPFVSLYNNSLCP